MILPFHPWKYLYRVHWFRYQIPDNWPYQEARQLFKEPMVLTDEKELDIKWTSPDEEVRYSVLELQYHFKCI